MHLDPGINSQRGHPGTQSALPMHAGNFDLFPDAALRRGIRTHSGLDGLSHRMQGFFFTGLNVIDHLRIKDNDN